MATQSLYRRYRPRRFSEVKGQDHVTKALRNAVANGRQGHAYLFSGPRGTGKTSTARILAKVLNCEHPQDGEPCCECASCVSVEAGTSFDVHELDAASNNGVEAMRELIDKAMLGTPGRHKVYILDEVHMLSKGAEGALLKTLEEPPSHVVFVLATTDPQKVSETIRSRTQPFQFHLLPMDVMADHIRWLASDAHLELDEAALDAVLRQGGGSARDTISSLEVVLASGGVAPDETPLDEFIESLIESDPGRALAAVAASIRQGRDARVLTESIIGHLRDCFLCLMAPELVALTDQRAAEVGRLAERLGAASTVRSIETLGTILVEMRHAPDPRVLLEVALVKLTVPSVEGGLADLTARLAKLERAVAAGGLSGTGSSTALSAVGAGAGSVVPTAARATFGSRARREATETAAPPATIAAAVPSPPPARVGIGSQPAFDAPVNADAAAGVAGESDPVVQAIHPPATTRTLGDQAQLWQSASARLRPVAKGRYASAQLVALADGIATFAFPPEMVKRGEENRLEVERVLSEQAGSPIRVKLVVGPAASSDRSAGQLPTPAADIDTEAEDDIDLAELVDAPRGPVISPIDRIAAAFPGVKLSEES